MSTDELLEELKELISSSNNLIPKDWMNIQQAATYAGVSYNTFMKFRIMGLRIAEVEGIKRVSRKEIDTFLENHSF